MVKMAQIMTQGKRKRTVLALQDKMDILSKLDGGESMCKLAREYGVGRATIHDFEKNRQKLLDYVKTGKSGLQKRKTLRVGVCPRMEDALYAWYAEERSKGVVMSGRDLRDKAIELYGELNEKDDFTASAGWLDRFKRRFGIRLSGEKTAESPPPLPFVSDFEDKIAELGLLPDQVYSADESSLFWRLSADGTTPGRRGDRVIFMPCSNATGTHKLDLLVVGRTRNPKAFGNVSRLPVRYRSHCGSWVTRETLGEWFREDFVPEVRRFMRRHRLPERALLVLDEGPDEPGTELVDGEIRTVFVPSSLQPTDQDVLRKVKSAYREKLLLHVVSRGGDLRRGLEDFDARDLVFCLADAWSSVSPDLIRSSWKKLWPSLTTNSPDEHDVDDSGSTDWLHNLSERGFEIKREELSSWFEEDVASDGGEGAAIEEVKVEGAPVERPTIKADEAFNGFNTCIAWAEENGIPARDVIVLRNMREKVFKQLFINN